MTAMEDGRAPDGPSPTRKLLELKQGLGEGEGRVSLGDVIDHLGPTGVGLMLLLLTLPAIVPIPGPLGLIFGSVIAFFCLQLLFGATRLWLPDILRRRTLPARHVATLVDRAAPVLARVERVLARRRLLPLTGRLGRMLLAVPLFLMAVAIALPVPLGNIPPALSLIALSLGLMMRDGVAILVGLGLAVLAALWFALLTLFGAQLWTWATNALGFG